MRPKSLVLGNDNEVIPILISIHSPSESPKILDCTYNRGVMWKKLNYNVVSMDIDPVYKTNYVGDFRNMPFIEGESFDIVVFDPPHLPTSAASENSSKIWQECYGITNQKEMGRDGDNISQMFPDFLKEAKRVLKNEGIILAKIADIVHNHKYQWQHVDFINAANECGLTPCDLIIKSAKSSGSLTSSKWKTIKHVRKSHCYWIVVRKGKCEKID